MHVCACSLFHGVFIADTGHGFADESVRPGNREREREKEREGGEGVGGELLRKRMNRIERAFRGSDCFVGGIPLLEQGR